MINKTELKDKALNKKNNNILPTIRKSINRIKLTVFDQSDFFRVKISNTPDLGNKIK